MIDQWLKVWKQEGEEVMHFFADWLEEQPGPHYESIGRLLRQTGILFTPIPAGSYWKSDKDSKFKKKGTFLHDYYLGVYPVTHGQWYRIMKYQPSFFVRGEFTGNRLDDLTDAEIEWLPVENIKLPDVRDFLRELAKKANGWIFTLPTKEEWEYACRGAPTKVEEYLFDYYLDKPVNEIGPDQACFNWKFMVDPSDKTKLRVEPENPYCLRPIPVGSYPPNRLGLYDMHGNIAEMIGSRTPTLRIYKGGAWNYSANGLKIDMDITASDNFPCYAFGLRVLARPITTTTTP